MIVIVFDTETTGLPAATGRGGMPNPLNPDRLVDYRDARMVELAYKVYQDSTLVKSVSCFVNDSETVARLDSDSAADARRIHGITAEMCRRHGASLRFVMGLFLKDASRAHVLVGHNLDFDLNVVTAEIMFLRRAGCDFNFQDVAMLRSKEHFCTMKRGYEVFELPRYPKLDALYREVTKTETARNGNGGKKQHRALVDVTKTAMCYFGCVAVTAAKKARTT